MQHIFLSIIFLLAWASWASASVNPAAKAAVRKVASADPQFLKSVRLAEVPPMVDGSGDGDDGNSTAVIPLVLKLAEGCSVADLPARVAVLHQRANLVLAYVPVDLLEELGASRAIVRLEASLNAAPSLDVARPVCGVDRVQAGSGLPYPFTGKGVVAGFCDVGFDPNHAAFIDPATGENRVRLMVDFTLDPEEPVRSLCPDEFADYLTDNPDLWHATHVAGILAGAYEGNPYSGVATAADIVATTSTLYEAQLLAGVEEVIGYANSVGRPAVVNISIASNTGPRDGSTLFNQYMDMLASEAAICISAGNDGCRRGYIGHSFTGAAPQPLKSYFISYPSGSAKCVEGYVGFWSDNSRPLQLSLVAHDAKSGSQAFLIPLDMSTPDGEALICSPSVAQDLGVEPDETFSALFDGYVWAAWELNPENNRYNILLEVAYKAPYDEVTGATAFLGFALEGHEGDHVDVYGSESIYFGSFGSGATRGSSDQQINDFCAGQGVICVGAYASRDVWPLLDGTPYSSSGTAPAPGVFTYNSYGDLPDGRHLPHLCAPGSYLISAISEPFLVAHPERLPRTSAEATAYGRDHHWIAECGTSMSSPYLAGVFALWLEADPTLTPSELLEIAIATAIPPVNNSTDPRWGAGTVDAYAGLLEVLARSGVNDVSADAPQLGDTAVFDLHGRRVASSPSDPLPPGIYVSGGRKFVRHY